MRLFLLTALGLILGWLAANSIQLGYLERWQIVSPPPQPPSRLYLLLPLHDLYVRGPAGDLYLTYSDTGLWEPVDSVPTDPHPEAQSSLCNTSSIPHLPFTRRPPGASQCLEIRYPMHETGFRVAYALSPDGQIWEWSHGRGVWEGLAYCATLPIIGASLGLLLGVILSRVQSASKPQAGA